MASRLSASEIERAHRLYAEHGSRHKVAELMGRSEFAIMRVLRDTDSEFSSYRRLVRMRATDRAWKPLMAAADRLAQLIPECTDIRQLTHTYEKLARIHATSAGYSADNQAQVSQARKPIEMNQTTTVLDGNAVAQAVRDAQTARDSESGASNGNRLHELRG